VRELVTDHPDQQTEPAADEAVDVEAACHGEIMEGITTRTLE
jgi:hypothetical protein